jgi:mono/diheme cytochrome c family protein
MPDARLVAQGDSIFKAISCARCHGADGAGSETGPSLVSGPWLHVDGSVAAIAAIIVSGVPREALKGEGRTRAMGARGGPANLSDAQVQAVASYVYTISRAKR